MSKDVRCKYASNAIFVYFPSSLQSNIRPFHESYWILEEEPKNVFPSDPQCAQYAGIAKEEIDILVPKLQTGQVAAKNHILLSLGFLLFNNGLAKGKHGLDSRNVDKFNVNVGERKFLQNLLSGSACPGVIAAGHYNGDLLTKCL